jgi:hypothetical protein
MVETTALILPAMTTPTRMNPITRRHPSMSRGALCVDIQPFDRNARIRLMGSSSAVTRCFPRMRRIQDHPEARMRYIQYNAKV